MECCQVQSPSQYLKNGITQAKDGLVYPKTSLAHSKNSSVVPSNGLTYLKNGLAHPKNESVPVKDVVTQEKNECAQPNEGQEHQGATSKEAEDARSRLMAISQGVPASDSATAKVPKASSPVDVDDEVRRRLMAMSYVDVDQLTKNY